jgi:hypothetical protein
MALKPMNPSQRAKKAGSDDPLNSRGNQFAQEGRAAANNLTDSDRKALFALAMRTIYAQDVTVSTGAATSVTVHTASAAACRSRH